MVENKPEQNETKTTKRTTKPRTTTRKKSAPASKQEEENVLVKNEVVTKEEPAKPELTTEDYVVVRNGYQGRLVYISQRTNEEFVWDAFGDEQEMQLRELKNAKSSNKGFFEKNWFMFDDPEVIQFLGLSGMYKNAIPVDDFDTIFFGTEEEVKEKLLSLPSGQKASVRYRAKELIDNGKVDSLKVIKVIEEVLNVSFDRE